MGEVKLTENIKVLAMVKRGGKIRLPKEVVKALSLSKGDILVFACDTISNTILLETFPKY